MKHTGCLHFITLMNLLHLPTSVNCPQDIISHIQVVHRLQVKSMHSLIRVWFLNPFRLPSSQCEAYSQHLYKCQYCFVMDCILQILFSSYPISLVRAIHPVQQRIALHPIPVVLQLHQPVCARRVDGIDGGPAGRVTEIIAAEREMLAPGSMGNAPQEYMVAHRLRPDLRPARHRLAEAGKAHARVLADIVCEFRIHRQDIALLISRHTRRSG